MPGTTSQLLDSFRRSSHELLDGLSDIKLHLKPSSNTFKVYPHNFSDEEITRPDSPDTSNTEESVNMLVEKSRSINGQYYDISSFRSVLILAERAFSFIDKMPGANSDNYEAMKRNMVAIRKIADNIHALQRPNHFIIDAAYIQKVTKYMISINKKMEEFSPEEKDSNLKKIPTISDKKSALLAEFLLTCLEMLRNTYLLDENKKDIEAKWQLRSIPMRLSGQKVLNMSEERKKANTLFYLLKARFDDYKDQYKEKSTTASNIINVLKIREVRLVRESTHDYDYLSAISEENFIKLQKASLDYLQELIDYPEEYMPILNHEEIQRSLKDLMANDYPDLWVSISKNSIKRSELYASFAFSEPNVLNAYIAAPTDINKEHLMKRIQEELIYLNLPSTLNDEEQSSISMFTEDEFLERKNLRSVMMNRFTGVLNGLHTIFSKPFVEDDSILNESQPIKISFPNKK